MLRDWEFQTSDDNETPLPGELRTASRGGGVIGTIVTAGLIGEQGYDRGSELGHCDLDDVILTGDSGKI